MLQHLSKHIKSEFTSMVVVGGASLYTQRQQLDLNPDLIVATPGRLLDHLWNTKNFNLDDVEVLILDEADRLIEMGFKTEITKIVNQCSHEKR